MPVLLANSFTLRDLEHAQGPKTNQSPSSLVAVAYNSLPDFRDPSGHDTLGASFGFKSFSNAYS